MRSGVSPQSRAVRSVGDSCTLPVGGDAAWVSTWDEGEGGGGEGCCCGGSTPRLEGVPCEKPNQRDRRPNALPPAHPACWSCCCCWCWWWWCGAPGPCPVCCWCGGEVHVRCCCCCCCPGPCPVVPRSSGALPAPASGRPGPACSRVRVVTCVVLCVEGTPCPGLLLLPMGRLITAATCMIGHSHRRESSLDMIISALGPTV